MKRITVSDIRALQGLQKNSERILFSETATFIKIITDQIILYTNSFELRVHNLSNCSLICSRKLTLPKVKNVVKIGKLFAVIPDSSCQLLVCNLQANKSITLNCHLRHINDLCSYANCFITASKDMTVRLWQTIEYQPTIKDSELKPVKFPIALKGHKGSVNCLAVYDKFLISGSEDKSIICWANRQTWTSMSFNEGIIKIIPCVTSSQIIILTQDKIVHFIQLNSIIKKKIQVKGTLDLGGISSPLLLSQIDDSFMVVGSKNKFQFVEVNLIKIIHQIDVDSSLGNKMSDIKCKGRCIIYGENGFGVKIIKI